MTDPLDPDLASYYQTMIGVMRWMVEIGRIEIAIECSLLSSHLAYHREGHFECALHMMATLSGIITLDCSLTRNIQTLTLTLSMMDLNGNNYMLM